MIDAQKKLLLEEVQYVYVPVLANNPAVTEPQPGFHQARFALSITDTNSLALDDAFKTELVDKISAYHVKLNSTMAFHCQDFGKDAILTKVNAFQEAVKSQYIGLCAAAPEKIEEYRKINLNNLSGTTLIEYLIEFYQELWHNEKNILSYRILVRVNRKRPVNTTWWTAPPKHLFERNFETYSKIFQYK